MLSIFIFDSSLSDIHLHTSMMTCLGFVFISWASFFSISSRDREVLSRMILVEINLEPIISIGRVWGGGG